MSKYPVENGLEKSDSGALSDSQRKDLRQLKVDVQKIDENYIRAHPELDVLCYELIREVLHRRPADPIAFSADFFTSPELKSHIQTKMSQTEKKRDLEFTADVNRLQI